MILVALAVLCLLWVPATGGDLRRLAGLELRAPQLALAGLALQIWIVNVAPEGDHGLRAALHLASYGLAAGFVLANRRLPGVLVMAAGGALNLAAIAANGGVMPASAWAVAASGLEPEAGFENSATLAAPRLAALGDVIPVPAGPLANVLSVGDLLVFAGLCVLLVRTCGGATLGTLRARI